MRESDPCIRGKAQRRKAKQARPDARLPAFAPLVVCFSFACALCLCFVLVLALVTVQLPYKAPLFVHKTNSFTKPT